MEKLELSRHVCSAVPVLVNCRHVCTADRVLLSERAYQLAGMCRLQGFS